MRRISRIALAVLLCASVALAADPSTRKLDTFWTAPDLASFDLRSIAFLPVATFDGNLEARRLTEDAVGRAFKTSGHRWVSTLVTRELIRNSGGDSLLKALNQDLLDHARLDSLQAGRYSRLTRARALLVVRVDQFEKREVEFNQSGKPTTTLHLRAALVDSSGRLLWTARGTENAEGTYHDANAGAIGVNSSGLNNRPVTGQGGAPGYLETANKLLARWVEAFPRKAAADSTAAH